MSFYGNLIYYRERQLSLIDKNRRVLPFEWGLDFLGLSTGKTPLQQLKKFSRQSLRDSKQFFAVGRIRNVSLKGKCLTFSSPLPTSCEFNDRVTTKLFLARTRSTAVIVIPQWNADRQSHNSLCHALQRLGITSVRFSLPYHDDRRPPMMKRADYMVSPNLGRTIHAIRQAVMEILQLSAWLRHEGYKKISIVGTSLGSCVAYLAFIHDPRITCGVFNHVSSQFADVVWRGLSTHHVRRGLEGRITLRDLRDCWAPISPINYIHSLVGDSRPHRLITAKYDLSFPNDLTETVFQEYKSHGLEYDRVNLPCGHYTTATFPFKFLDGWHICSYLYRLLR